MKLNLRLFAAIKECAGTSKLEIKLSDSAEYLFPGQILYANCAISLFAPVRGG
jgi:hypothetical protein